MDERKNIKKLTDQRLPVRKGKDLPQEDYSDLFLNPRSVKAVFRRHNFELIKFIRSYPVHLGAIAWLTDLDVIAELSSSRVALIVQKEDFLRPDVVGSKAKLRSAYESLYSFIHSNEVPGVVQYLQSIAPFEIDPIRCVGNVNRTDSPAFPRMHNKFLIGCDYKSSEEIGPDAEGGCVIPKAVWTGSYNFTFTAATSFENALIVEDPRVARAFALEWSQIFALSEPLNWSEDWVSPEYWLGT